MLDERIYGRKRKPVTLDGETGKVIPISRAKKRRSMRGLGETQDTRSIGAAFWELLHPSRVQAEYEAVGAPVPTIGEVIGGAFDDAMTAAAEGEHNIGENLQAAASAAGTVGKWLIVGLGFAAVIALTHEFSARRRSKDGVPVRRFKR